MRKYYLHIGVLISFLVILTGFKKNSQHEDFLSSSLVKTADNAELPEIIISDVTTIQSDKGQTPVEIMVCLSKASSEPVTVEYTTENGTAIAGVDYVATSGSIKFEPGEIAKSIAVQIIGEVAADPDEDAHPVPNVKLTIKMIKAIGAFIKKNQSGLLTIIKNVTLFDPRNTGSTSAYQVLIEYHGYTTMGGTLADCHVRRNGRVYLNGILEGNENFDTKNASDPVLYTGKLWMNINMDICSVERNENADPPDKFCYMSVAGFGYVSTELELDPFGARYSYFKIDGDTTKFYRNVVGDCFSQLAEERENVPNNSIASIFNGLQFDKLVDATGSQLRTLRKGTYSQTDADGNVTTVTVLRKIR